MKAKQVELKPMFKPVSLILETQEEVDAIYAIFNLGGLVEAVGLKGPWTILTPFKDHDNGARLYEQAIKCLRKGGF